MSLPKPTTPSTASLIGVAVAVSGNVLISLALNCQKLAHQRLQREWEEAQRIRTTPEYEDSEDLASDEGGDDDEMKLGRRATTGYPCSMERVNEHTSLLRASPESYGSGLEGSTTVGTPEEAQNPTIELLAGSGDPTGSKGKDRAGHTPPSSLENGDLRDDEERHEHEAEGSESDSLDRGGSTTHGGTKFLRSKLWWLGIGLMILGEGGNFISYGFAPASLVAPLGAVALLSNVLISPLLLHEWFSLADLGGILLAIIGAVTVVFSSKQNDKRLSPDSLWKSMKRVEFIIYASISVCLAVLLCIASTTRAGDKVVLIDVGVCAVFGAFTVLSTKAISSLLSRGNPFDMFRYPITYVLIFVLVSTAVVQITYLNRALQRFDSRQVITTQFVFFTISAIIGSAVLYRDFEDADVHRLINFFFGCLTTFAGVFVLTRRNSTDESEEPLSTRRLKSRTRRRPARSHATEHSALGKITDSWTSGTATDSMLADDTAPERDEEEVMVDEGTQTDDEQLKRSRAHAQGIKTPASRKPAAIRFREESPSSSLHRSPWLQRHSLSLAMPRAGSSDTAVTEVRKGSQAAGGSIPTLVVPGSSTSVIEPTKLSRSVPAPVSPLSSSLPFTPSLMRFGTRPVSSVAEFPLSTAAPTGLLSAGQYLLLPSISTTPQTGVRSRSRQRSLSQPSTPTKKRSRRALRDNAASRCEHNRVSGNSEQQPGCDLEAAVSSEEEGSVGDQAPHYSRDHGNERRRSSGRRDRPKSDVFDSFGWRKNPAS